jgi:wyosine [tRNA(Phe)-imidazoG37] synthetase (radical SAM superfamily)
MVYGPVMSWRYGRSLGIDPVPPPKRCTFNCVYCQLGPTKNPVHSVDAVQETLPDENQLYNQLDEYLRQISIESLDVVTFSGSGEPTLNLHLGSMAGQVRKRLPELPIVLLSNGSLLGHPKAMMNLSEFDIVTVKFDAGDDETHRAINRPLVSFQHDQLVKAIHRLRTKTNVTIALEVMLLKLTSGISNIGGKPRETLVRSLVELASVVDIIQLYTPWRPPAEQHVQPIKQSELRNFALELNSAMDVERIWVYGSHDARKEAASWKSHQSLRNDVLTMLQRRPCRLNDLAQSLDTSISSLLPLISQLRRVDAITVRQHLNEVYYSAQNEA